MRRSFLFYLNFTVLQDYFTYFEPNQWLDGVKLGDPSLPIKRNRNLACLTCDPSRAQMDSCEMFLDYCGGCGWVR